MIYTIAHQDNSTEAPASPNQDSTYPLSQIRHVSGLPIRMTPCTHSNGGRDLRATAANRARPNPARADEVGVIESSLVSCGESGLLGGLVECSLVVHVRRCAGCWACGWVGVGELSQAGLE